MHTRREFLRQAGTATAAATAAAAIGPTILYATDKAGARRPVMGEGAHVYEAWHDWGTLPASIRYGNTHGVCTDSQNRVYIHHTVGADSESADTMVVFDAKGKFIKSWGKEFKGGAHGLHIRKEGRDEYLYLCDTKRALMVKTTLAGEVVYTLDYPKQSEPYAPGIKYSPTNVAIAPNGDVYVADGYGSSYINQYNAKGEYIRTFGGKGSAPGQLDCPHGLTIDTRSQAGGPGAAPLLMVADRSNKRIQTFTLDGRHAGFIDGTNAPCHFHEHNGLMVVPDLWARVTLLDAQNKVVAQLGDAGVDSWKAIRKGPRDLFTPGKFVCPHSACFDRDGNIFVVEWVEVGRVTKLVKV